MAGKHQGECDPHEAPHVGPVFGRHREPVAVAESFRVPSDGLGALVASLREQGALR